MKVLAAYLLASLSGETPSAATINKVLGAVGIEADSARVDKLLAELSGKSVEDLIAEGSKKLASVPAAAVGGAAAPAAAAGGAAAAKEEKKEEKVEEESDDDMGFGLFD